MKKLRVGVVGLGMGLGHARGYMSHPQVDLVALCDMDTNKLAAEASTLGVAQTYGDAVDMFDRAELDAVSIAVPNKLHAPLTIAAFEHGLHVLCETDGAHGRRSRRMLIAARRAHKIS